MASSFGYPALFGCSTAHTRGPSVLRGRVAASTLTIAAGLAVTPLNAPAGLLLAAAGLAAAASIHPRGLGYAPAVLVAAGALLGHVSSLYTLLAALGFYLAAGRCPWPAARWWRLTSRGLLLAAAGVAASTLYPQLGWWLLLSSCTAGGAIVAASAPLLVRDAAWLERRLGAVLAAYYESQAAL